MAYVGARMSWLGRIWRSGALVFSAAALASGAVAQQPAANKAPAAAPAQTTSQAEAARSGWAKVCEELTATSKDKDGKDVTRAHKICLTQNERLDANTGRVRFAVAIRQVDNQPKQFLMVTVPLGMLLEPGLRAAVYPNDIWEKAQKGAEFAKADEAKLKPLTLTYALCHPGGCDAELEATPQVINDLKAGGGLMILTRNGAGETVSFPVPLAGFDTAYGGASIDSKTYAEGRRALLQQIEDNQTIKGTIVVPKKQPF